jgi:hypothetical protein
MMTIRTRLEKLEAVAAAQHAGDGAIVVLTCPGWYGHGPLLPHICADEESNGPPTCEICKLFLDSMLQPKESKNDR